MKKTIAFIVILYMSLVGSGCISNMIYHPRSEIRHTPASVGIAYEPVWLEASDGVGISAWWVPVPDAAGTVLFFHGNAGNIGDRLDTVRIITGMGLNLLIIDYRGFGRSEGFPSEKGLYRDADAAMDYLVLERRIDSASIILWGRSLGGGVAAWMAVNREAGILIVESAFTSMADIANEIFPWVPTWLLRNHSYKTAGHLASVDIPTLIIHSRDDEVIPFHHGNRLYETVSAPKSFVEIHGSHNDGFLVSFEVYKFGITRFISAQK